MGNWIVLAARKRAAGLAVQRARRAASSRKLRLEELESRLVLSAYYVSPSGNDSNNGTSQNTPWKTIAKVNITNLNPGDSVRFLGGATFSGSSSLVFQPVDTGTAANPILISSYGTGRATISMTGNQRAIEGQQVSGYRISNLNFKGPGWANSTKAGIHFYTWENVDPEFLQINNVSVSGFGATGIQIQASTGGGTYRDIVVTDSDLSGNRLGGFETIGPGAGGNHSARTIFNVYLSGLRVFNNAGISFGSVDGGVLERSISANSGYTGDVPTGVFVYDSTNVVIRNNEVYGIENYGTGTDGNGISLDYGADRCIVEGNYTHGNTGAGILLVGSNKPGLPPTTNNIVRYNVSENNGTKYSFAEISLYVGVINTEVYNNTVYAKNRDAFQIWHWKGSGAHVRNNIFMTNGGANSYVVNVYTPADPNQKLKDLDVVFQGNNYYSSGGPFNIHWGEEFYHTLANWRNGTGQEKLFNLPVGTSFNPLLVNPGGGGTVGDPNQLDNMTAYQLRPRSRLRNLGLNLSLLFGLDIGDWDFFGNGLPSALIAVGAHDPIDTGGLGSNDRNSGGSDFDPLNAAITTPLPLSMFEQTEMVGTLGAPSSVQWLNQPASAVQGLDDESEIGVAQSRPMPRRPVHDPVLESFFETIATA